MTKQANTIVAMLLSLLMLNCAPHASAQQTDDTQTDDRRDATTESQRPGSVQSSSIVLETTSVTGSRELPKVLVIVPWKTSEALGPGERPLASLVEEALTPLDPDEFRREINYYTELNDSSKINSDDANTSDENDRTESATPE